MKIVTFCIGERVRAGAISDVMWTPVFICGPELAAATRKSIAAAKAEAMRTGQLASSQFKLGAMPFPLAADLCTFETEADMIEAEAGVVLARPLPPPAEERKSRVILP